MMEEQTTTHEERLEEIRKNSLGEDKGTLFRPAEFSPRFTAIRITYSPVFGSGCLPTSSTC